MPHSIFPGMRVGAAPPPHIPGRLFAQMTTIPVIAQQPDMGAFLHRALYMQIPMFRQVDRSAGPEGGLAPDIERAEEVPPLGEPGNIEPTE